MPRSGSTTRAGAARVTRHTRSTTGSAGSATSASRVGSPSSRQGKFNAKGEHVNGKWCASGAEAERYRQLLAMDMAGTISSIVCQERFRLIVNNHVICNYRADFSYQVLDEYGGVVRTVVEDVKGFETPEFKLKRKLFDATQDVPLSVIDVKGKARHPDRPDEEATGAGWLHKHWKNKLPD